MVLWLGRTWHTCLDQWPCLIHQACSPLIDFSFPFPFEKKWKYYLPCNSSDHFGWPVQDGSRIFGLLRPFESHIWTIPNQQVGAPPDLSRPGPQKWGLGLKFFAFDPPRPSKWGYPTLMKSGGKGFDLVTRPADPHSKKLKFKIKIIDFRFYLFSSFDILLARLLSLLNRSYWLTSSLVRSFRTFEAVSVN